MLHFWLPITASVLLVATRVEGSTPNITIKRGDGGDKVAYYNGKQIGTECPRIRDINSTTCECSGMLMHEDNTHADIRCYGK